MDEDEQRRRKVEAGRAKLAQFRQRKAKGESANSKKKTAKRKGTPVTTPVPEEAGAVASEAPEAGQGTCLSPSHSNSSARPVTASQEGRNAERLQDLEQLQKTREAMCPQQAEVFTKEQEQECELAAAAMQGSQIEADERPQTQPVPSLELEALRLSLSNMHTAQLELTQANLQREKETALVELRNMLNERHAQELALAQSRQQLERDQHAREREELALRCGQEAAELKEKLQSEMEKNAQVIAALQQDWASERDLCLENLRSELSAKHQSELEQLQSQFSRELAEQKAELEKIFQAKDQAESTLQTLEAQHNETVRKLQEDLQAECSQHLRDLEIRFKEKEAAKQRELEELQASYEELKAQSREEIRRLWAQLAPVGGSRQESSEVQEQFQARQFHEEELEHLKRDFAQQRQREKTEHESELEELRIYFEKKLQDAERSYREDLLLLQQRLQEVKEDSLLESGELSSSSTLLEETSGKEGREWPDKLSLQLEPPEESLICLHTELEEAQRCHLKAQMSPPHVTQVLDVADAGERGLGPSEESRQGLARVCLRCAQDTALEVEAEVAARVSGLETKHKVKLSLLRTELKEEIDLLKIENRNLHEKLRYEIHLREELVKVKHALVENHQQELKQTQEKIQVMKQELKEKEAKWAAVAEEGRREAEEKLTLALLELRERAESEKQSIISKFELREEDMRQLQAQQAAQILDLEASLVEQQGRLRQLELAADEAVLCDQCGQEAGDSLETMNSLSELTTLRLKEDCALQLMLAQNRFLEERKKITEKFTAEQDASLREAQQKHEVELRLLREQHQQHVQSLTVELESKHRLEVEELRATWESEQRALSDAHVAQLQSRHAAEVGALETKHLANLDSLEACYVSAVQAVQDEHRRALELLQTELEGQLQKKEASHQLLLTQELQKLQLRHEEELRAMRHSLVEKGSTGPPESLLTTAPQGESQRTTAMREEEEAHRLELEQAQSLHQGEKLQEKASQIQQLKDQVVSLHQEVDEHRSKLETLQQRRERENQEGEALISMLRADTELAREERQALAEALKRLLGLFGEMLKAAVALRGRISERVGLCLEDERPPLTQPGDQEPGTGLVLNELWAGSTLLEPDTMLLECSDLSSVGDISSHICESFMSPDSTLEWEPSVRRVFQSLDLAVNALLEMVLDSSRQLEEARQTHSRFEREFSCKNEETARVVLKHQELLRRLDEESAATTRLTRELHEARGVIEGFREEQASLQEVLNRKDSAEQDLVADLERLRLQLQQEAQQAAALKEENVMLQGQRETAAAEARDKEEALQQQVASLSQQQLETRKQSEKDRAALLAQMKVLESELEEQLVRQQACAQQDSELAALRQQLDSLDKHLRSQRQFMDEQAVEREHEREEFQQEIQRLEEQLRQSARPQPRGPGTSEPVPLDKEDESLQEKLREKLDELSEMTLKRELAEKQVLHQQEEMRRLEEADCASRAAVGRLQEQLEKQRHELRSLQQDKEALQEQQMNHLLLVSTLQSRLDEAKCPLPPKDPGAQLEAVQQTLLQRECEVLQLTEQLEQARADLAHRDEEVLRLHLQLDVQDRVSAGIRALQEENAWLKTSLQSKEAEILGMNQRLEEQLAGTGAAPVEEVVPQRSSELEELRSVIETLRENQGRLQRERVEEVERLHEVIERLQGELGLEGPQAQAASAGRAGSLQSELDGATADGTLEGELQAALAAREALSQLLAERELGHRQALEALQQRLQAAEEAATHRLAQLVRLEQQEAEAQDVAARLRDCEARVVARDLQVAALSRRRLAHHTQLEAILAACARLRLSLEQLPPTEPPELQHLRMQCLRLSRQLQVLGQRFKKELGVLQQGAPLPDSQADKASGDGDSERDKGSRLLNSGPPDLGGQLQGAEEDDLPLVKGLESGDKAGLHAPDGVLSVLAVCQRQLEAELLQIRNEMHLCVDNFSKTSGYRKGKENLQKVDLITQVEQLQDKLNHLSCSLNGQDIEAKACPSLDPLELSQAQEGPLSGHSSNAKGSDTAPPEDTVATDEASWCPLDTLGTQDSLKRCNEPRVPEEEEAVLPLAPTGAAEPLKNSLRTMDLSSWSSPEAVRKDSTLDNLSGLVLTPCSEALSQHSLDMSLRDQRGTTRPQASWTGLSCSLDGPAAGRVLWAADGVSPTDLHVQQTSVEKDVEDFIITSLDSQDKSRSLPLGLEGNDDAGDSSECGEMLKPGSTSLEVPAAGPAALPVSSIRFCQSLGVMKEKELNPKQVKALLQMVCNESHQILALSEYRGLPSALSKGEPNTPECLPREGLGLMEVAPAVRGPLSPAPSAGEQEPTGLCLDWREEFLQLAQETFEKQREMLRAELQPQSQGGPEPGSLSSLWERLEKLACEQGGLRDKLLGPVQGPDRSSLLSEVQALRAQLRMTHLQNQEKLQQLCAALTSAEARGSRREHQLRRQVELLAYKVEQEKCIASDLQKTLSAEQDKASGAQRLLSLEQGVVRDLKAELSQCRQESEQLRASLSDVQQEVHQLRSLLDCKEQDLRTALQELEAARGQEGTLEGRLQEVQLRHLQKEGQSAKALEELQSSLDRQVTQSDRLRVALKQEQTARDNLQKELRIESSRCEALLAQEQARLAELQRGLEAERARTQELSAALQHERLLTEQLSLRVREACTHREGQAQRTLLRKLRDEQARVRELQASLEQAQQLALCTQQQLEVEVQARCEELRREKEVSAEQPSPWMPQPSRPLQAEQAQAELEQPPWRPRVCEGRRAAGSGSTQSPADVDGQRQRQRDKEKLRELELQRQRDAHKVKQLQRAVQELEAEATTGPCLQLEQLQQQRQGLEKARQQLLCAAGLLSSFISQTLDRTLSDWTSSNEKAVASLLHTLEEVKSELTTASPSLKKDPVGLPVRLMDILLKDNECLRQALGSLAQEKAELSRTVSRLEKTLKHHLLKGCALSKSDRSASKQDRSALQRSTRHPEPGLLSAASGEDASSGHIRMEKLYLHYLRAESFRKALIYQKKYLLLLIGGFQDSEQETLSMIAHLGVFPSKADRKATTSRPFTRFRTAVRVVVAIFRLRFLVKKWQEVDRKGALGRPVFLVPRQKQTLPETSESPPTREASSGCTRDTVPKTSPRRRERCSSSHSRSESFLTASQDPECSLTEYIHHLEKIQQRLGGLPPDSTSKKHIHQKNNQ